MTNKEQLPEWRKALNSAVENYQSAQSWYEENRDSPSAGQDMDAAEGEIEKLLKQYGVLIVLSLMDEIDELQDLRRSCLALRGEIEDVQAQLYEAENRNNADDEELQERRKADSAEPACYALTNMAGEVYNTHSSAQNAGAYRDLIHQGDDSLTLRVTPLYTVPPAPVMPAELHPDTQNLVADFCTALAEKLYKAQLKYGYDADWKQDGWHTQCLAHFHQHIAKGDPRDVAAYCAFMWYHGWKTESVSAPVVPEEITDESTEQRLMGRRWAHSFCAGWNACRATMLQGKYRDLSQPVDPQISEYEKIMGQAGNSPVIPDGYALVPVEPTDEMIVAAMDSDDVTYNESDDTVFYVHHCEIYKAMLAAAPQPEISDGK
ncbi:TPA: hypothetical protein G8O01_001211 [Salmonella enterica]|nr:hypothetical protein [Salmonella enterica]